MGYVSYYEDDLEQILGRRPRMPEPEVEFCCPICHFAFAERRDRDDHLIEAHPLDQPWLYRDGRPASLNEEVLSAITSDSFVAGNATRIEALVDGRRSKFESSAGLGEFLAGLRRAHVKLRLENHRIADDARGSAEFTLDIEVLQEADMAIIDQVFVKRLGPGDIHMGDVDDFANAVRDSPALRYADALCNYTVGVLVKEQDRGSGATLPFEEYVTKFRQAATALRGIDRPLSAIVRTAIRFNLNDFGDLEGDPHKLGSIGRGFEFFHSIAAGRAPRRLPILSGHESSKAVCPVDAVTQELVVMTERERRSLPALTLKRLRDAVHEPMVGPSDRSKYAVLLALAARAGAEPEIARQAVAEVIHDATFKTWARAFLKELQA